MEIGEKLKELRLKKDLTLSELASRSEVTKGFLSQLERDLTSPNVSTLENILEALGTNLQDFFSEQPEEQIVFGKDDFFVDERDYAQVQCPKESNGAPAFNPPSPSENPSCGKPWRPGIRLCSKRANPLSLWQSKLSCKS